MRFRDFRIGWRLLFKEAAYSAVVVLGLSVGFAACFLLLGFVRYSLSYDLTVPQVDRVYLVTHRLNIIGKPAWYESTPLPYAAVAQRSGLVDSAVVVVPTKLALKVGTNVQQLDFLVVQPTFQSLLGIQPLEGDLQQALSHPDQVALTVSAARRLFDAQHVLGKTVEIAGKPYIVSALLADTPSNTTVPFEALTGIDSNVWSESDRKFLMEAWANIGGKIYLKLKQGVSAAQMEKLLQDASDNSPLSRQMGPDTLRKLGGKHVLEIHLGALRNMYFNNDTANNPMSSQHGDRGVVFGLAAVALLILLLAATNYVNLATVRTLQRQREIAMRKVLGASVGRLIGQFLAESLVVALISTGIGLLLAWLLLPVFAGLVDRQLESMFTVQNLFFSLLLGLAVGLAAGLYPAWVALRVRPPQTLAGRGSSETVGGLWLRRVLTVVQFAVAIALTGVTLAIAWQTHFASDANPGFDPAPLLVLDLPENMRDPAATGLRDALARLPGVTGVAAALDPVGQNFVGANFTVKRNNGNKASVILRAVSPNFFDVYGLRPLAGRLFDSKLDLEDKNQVAVINRSAATALGYANAEDAVGQVLASGSGENAVTARVVGIAPDIRHESMRESPQPLYYTPSTDGSILTVRVSGDMGTVESAVEKLRLQYFPNDVVSVRRARSYFIQAYADDLRLAKLLAVSSLIAIAIASFGIYVLSAYSVQRRRREIVLRKLYGATAGIIARILTREFAGLIAIGALIGLPLAGVAIARYLASFVERAPMGIWPLAAALLLAVLVAFVATVRHTVSAMRMTPARVFSD